MSKLVTQGINEVIRVTDEVSEGNLDVQINVVSRDEIGYLLDGSLRSMIISLKELFKASREKEQRALEESKKARDALRLAEDARKKGRGSKG